MGGVKELFLKEDFWCLLRLAAGTKCILHQVSYRRGDCFVQLAGESPSGGGCSCWVPSSILVDQQPVASETIAVCAPVAENRNDVSHVVEPERKRLCTTGGCP